MWRKFGARQGEYRNPPGPMRDSRDFLIHLI
jgi:hypothetical protein